MSENNFVEWDDLFNADSFKDREFKKTVTLKQAIRFQELSNEDEEPTCTVM